jgi:hypothetical protein
MATRWLVRTTLGILLSIGVASTGFAQTYPGSGGSTSSTSTYSSSGKSYGSGTAIAIGAVAAGGVVAAILIYRHHHATKSEAASLVGCTEQANGVTTLMDDSTKTSYSLTSLSNDVKPGERVELAGRMKQDASGKNVFQVQKLVKDDGPCAPQTASAAAGANP